MRWNPTGIVVIFACLVMGCSTARVQQSPSAADYANKRIAVLHTDGKPGSRLAWTVVVAGEVQGTWGEVAAAKLESGLMSRYTVLERGLLNRIIEEQMLSSSDAVDPYTAVELGKLAGLDAIVTTQSDLAVVWVFPLLFANGNTLAKMISIETGNVVWSGNVKFRGISVLPVVPVWIDAQQQAADAILRELRRGQ